MSYPFVPPALEEHAHQVTGATEPVSVQLAERELFSSFQGTLELNCPHHTSLCPVTVCRGYAYLSE